MNAYELLQAGLLARPRAWLITGVAGFIGSNLLETLLRLNQRVVGLDNYSVGSHRNLEQVQERVGPDRWSHFLRLDGDIRDPETCQQACVGVDYILHHAASGSVEHSLGHPDEVHTNNVTGFLNILLAARDHQVKRVMYASCACVGGDEPGVPRVDNQKRRCFSPLALTKRTNELYADAISRCYGLETVGLRYFHVFGPRQKPDAPNATVIPRWIEALIQNQPVHLNGDGETSCDFCYVANVVQANLLAATAENPEAVNQVYNVAVRHGATLNQVFKSLRRALLPHHPHLRRFRPVRQALEPGDGSDWPADIAKAQRLLGFQPSHMLEQGLAETVGWFEEHLENPAKRRRRSPLRKPQAAAPVIPGSVSSISTMPQLIPSNAI